MSQFTAGSGAAEAAVGPWYRPEIDLGRAPAMSESDHEGRSRRPPRPAQNGEVKAPLLARLHCRTDEPELP